MLIPQTLQILISEANEAIKNHPNGELVLPYRKKIWMEFGAIQLKDVPVTGTKRRTMLEIINLERLMYLWEKVISEDCRPQIII